LDKLETSRYDIKKRRYIFRIIPRINIIGYKEIYNGTLHLSWFPVASLQNICVAPAILVKQIVLIHGIMVPWNNKSQKKPNAHPKKITVKKYILQVHPCKVNRSNFRAAQTDVLQGINQW